MMCEWGAFVQGIADYSRVLTVNAHTLGKRTPRMNATWHEFIFFVVALRSGIQNPTQNAHLAIFI